MKPVLGWAGLSRAALKRAEAQLAADAESVRDEVGVLALHTAYANRFFPGTSVQQTRLRYALFVPWQIISLLKDEVGVGPAQARAALERAEFSLARRLPDVDREGTIGRRTVKQGRSVAIPPSQSYWVALGGWGILASTPDGTTPARSELFARWRRWPDGRYRRADTDDEKRPLELAQRLFRSGLPEAPRLFFSDRPLDFILAPDERRFLRMRLMETQRPTDARPSFLATLVRAGVVPTDSQHPWSEALVRHADPLDQIALERARGAAAISAVARAIYYAAVETLQETRDGSVPGTVHREHLEETVARYAPLALHLDLAELKLDGVHVGGLLPVLTEIQAWLRKGTMDPRMPDLLKAMGDWELWRKGSRRAKLPLTRHGRLARDAWVAQKAAKAEPIDFRWRVIRTFLGDLSE